MAKKTAHVPSTPIDPTTGKRETEHVRSILLRMGEEFVDALDKIARRNGRSRREIVEILVSEAYVELQQDPNATVSPL